MKNLLKSYVIDSNIAKATIEITLRRKTSKDTSVQFANILRTNVISCGNGYPEERPKDISIDGLPANI